MRHRPNAVLRNGGAAILAAISALIPIDSTADSEASEPTDCAVRHLRFDDPDWTCRRASEWIGECIPAAEFTRWNCLELDSNATFCPGSNPFFVTVYLTTSGVELDCNGQTITHAWKEGDPRRSGLRATYTNGISEVMVRDCRVQDVGGYAIDLKRFFRGDELEQAMEGHRDITVQRVEIARTDQIGIYVGQNSRRVLIEDSSIDESFLGIYLEAGSTGTHVKKVRITNSREREAIAIDSSQHNVIEQSLFAGNRGGVHLYRNCGERRGQVCPIRRSMGASHNVLRANSFYGDDVNVGARQFRRFSAGWCSERTESGYWRDEAQDNLLESNWIVGSVVRLQDGPFVLRGNTFADGARVVVGATPPAAGEAFLLEGTLESNDFLAPSYLVVQGVDGSAVEMRGNRFVRE